MRFGSTGPVPPKVILGPLVGVLNVCEASFGTGDHDQRHGIISREEPTTIQRLPRCNVAARHPLDRPGCMKHLHADVWENKMGGPFSMYTPNQSMHRDVVTGHGISPTRERERERERESKRDEAHTTDHRHEGCDDHRRCGCSHVSHVPSTTNHGGCKPAEKGHRR